MSGMVGNAKGGLGGPYFSWENQKATWQGMVNLAFQGSRSLNCRQHYFKGPLLPALHACKFVAAFLIMSGDEQG